MPIYEFECPACSERFDRLQKLSDPDPDSCPHCGATGVRRCVTAPAFRLAGSGWYETDFKKDGDRKRNLAGDAAASDAKPSKSGDGAKAEPAKTDGAKTSAADSKAPAAPKPTAKDAKPG